MSDRANVTGGAGSIRGWRWRVAAVALIAPAAVLGVVGLAGRSTGQEAKGPRGKVASALLVVRREPDESAADYERRLAALAFTARTPDMFFHAVHGRPEILKELEALGQADPIRWMHDAVLVENLDRTDLLQVTCTAPSPKLATSVALAMSEAIIMRFANERNGHLELQIRQLDQAWMDAERLLKQKRDSLLASLAKLPPEDSLAASPAAAVEGLREVRGELRRVRLEKKAAEVRLARHKATDAGDAASGKTLEEAVAILDGQEELLRRDQAEGIEAIRRAESARIERKWSEDALDRDEGRRRSIEDQIYRVRYQMSNPYLMIYRCDNVNIIPD